MAHPHRQSYPSSGTGEYPLSITDDSLRQLRFVPAMEVPGGEEIEMQVIDQDQNQAQGPPNPSQAPRGWFKRHVDRARDGVRKLEAYLNRSTFGRVFRLEGSGHSDEMEGAHFSTEVRAGLTTFATMAYIIAVNANILSDTGGTCVCEGKPLVGDGNACFPNEQAYQECVKDVKRDLITATAALAGFSSFLFGFLTNLPVALGPGMGLNAYFAYQVVGPRGAGNVPYRLALTAVFVEGWIFMFLALTGMRHWLVRIIPGTIKTASGVGIGFFLALVGLSYSSGIGLVVGAVSTPLGIAGCDASEIDHAAGQCLKHVMANPKMWLGICGSGLLTALLMSFRVRSAIIIGIAIVSIISWPRGTPFTYFPDNEDGQERFDFFKQVVAFHPIQKVLAAQEWNLSGSNGPHFVLALFTFLYVDIIDCTATLYSMARFCNRTRQNDGDFPRSTIAYCTDALSISVGALMGCSPVTAFVESGAGIAEGGRTGLTAMVTGICFLLSIFFAPIFASIPQWATGCTLVLVGCLMVRQVTRINWRYIGDAIPSFVTMALIPFTYSVAYGLIAGLFVYTGLNVGTWVVIKCTRGELPKDYEDKEYWTWKPAGEKPWIVRVFTKGRFWEPPKVKSNENPDFNSDGSAESHCGDSIRQQSQKGPSPDHKYTHRVSSPVPFRPVYE